MKAEDVLNALDELSKEELARFKWFLQQPESLDGLPTIKKKQLESKESFDIVDLMVHTYTLQHCLEVTSKILEKLNRNDLLQRLLHYNQQENRMCSSLFSKEKETQLHNFLSGTKNEAKPRKKDDEVQQMINKIQEVKELVKISKDAADREKAEGVLIFTALKESADRRLKELIKEIKDKQKTTEKEAEDFIKDLEQEISNLKKSSSERDLHQRFSPLRDDPSNKNWTEVRVHPPSYEGTVERAVAQLKETLWEDIKMQLELKRVQQFAVDVTLDRDTAHPILILSDDRKQVYCGNRRKHLPDNPERFSLFANVLGQQSFSSGKFYFEVQVKGKTDWDLGVARESVDRKGEIAPCIEDGFWAIVLRNENEYSTGEDTSVLFDLHPGPEKVGVFVDYEEGLVSFYDIEAAALIYSFTGCCFTEKIYPYFSPYLDNGGTNSAPLIICPVNQAGRFSDEAP
ncbi:E3 ubiquitin-protein ligase TRIM21-like [Girardinichthys multiradiatus]|uniref:E3 ubiquitin-protein ligase TRIM21-like n=1 Tax=Girardinichthys multiradiatus TaxID=208333 RepID=UPI001FAD90AF|nr:E3 ubiquitin-protein ligase TRIM21-like [Girardinichthys multiradiatus]